MLQFSIYICSLLKALTAQRAYLNFERYGYSMEVSVNLTRFSELNISFE